MQEAVEHLVQAALDGDDERAEQCVASLDPNDGPQLQRLLAHPCADVRWWTVRSLAALDASPQVIAPLLADGDSCVRACAALALASVPYTPAVNVESIVNTLVNHLSDPDAGVADLCALALAHIGSEASPALADTLEHHHSVAVRSRAARALLTAATPDAIPVLFRALDDESIAVQYYAEEALERLGVGLVLFRP